MGGSRKGIANKLTKWDTHVVGRLEDIKQWILSGDTVVQISNKIGINPDTWYRYVREHEILAELVKFANEQVNEEVEQSLLRLCKGFEFEEVRTTVEEDKMGKKRKRIEKTTKYHPPSPSAIAFWLKNRSKEKWQENLEVAIDNKQLEEKRKKEFLAIIKGGKDK